MGKLIQFELEKIVKKKLVLLALGVLGIAIAWNIRSWQRSYFVVHQGQMTEGKEAQTFDKQLMEQYEGELTDEKVQRILAEFGGEEGNQNSVWQAVRYFFGNEQGEWNGKTVEEVFAEFEAPPVLGNTKGFETFSISYASYMLVFGIVILIAVSPVFAEECTLKMDGLILSSRHGKNKVVRAKVAASLIFTFVIQSVITAAFLGGMYMVFGNGDGEASMVLSPQLMFSDLQVDITGKEAVLYTVLTGFAAMMLLTLLVIFISMLCRSSFLALVTAAAVYFLPMFLSFFVQNDFVQKILSMTPGVLFNTHQILELGGRILPWTGAGIMAAVFAGMWLGGTGVYAKHQVQD